MPKIGYGLVSSDCLEMVQMHYGFPVAHLEIRLASAGRIDKTSSDGLLAIVKVSVRSKPSSSRKTTTLRTLRL
ncbi:hypothetical protein PanWU01x14_012790 [Parasponia andersonii]|uniref:Uncharacterized protein n=1 Tax=Parasponia andersonii TaxID=3476 RepID=A0A2P5E0V5_PARAD|nr:hypothetical protein PanWU01x14_012790 [Parasponia andersonii]